MVNFNRQPWSIYSGLGWSLSLVFPAYELNTNSQEVSNLPRPSNLASYPEDFVILNDHIYANYRYLNELNGEAAIFKISDGEMIDRQVYNETIESIYIHNKELYIVSNNRSSIADFSSKVLKYSSINSELPLFSSAPKEYIIEGNFEGWPDKAPYWMEELCIVNDEMYVIAQHHDSHSGVSVGNSTLLKLGTDGEYTKILDIAKTIGSPYLNASADHNGFVTHSISGEYPNIYLAVSYNLFRPDQEDFIAQYNFESKESHIILKADDIFMINRLYVDGTNLYFKIVQNQDNDGRTYGQIWRLRL